MNRKFATALCLAAFAGAAVPASGALGASTKGGTTVTVRVEGLKRTLLKTTVVTVPTKGSITKGGTPKGRCPESSAAGALDVATKHKWYGKYSASQNDIFITKILGEAQSGTTAFWDVYLNNVSTTTGACAVKLHKGAQLLFAAIPAKGFTYPLTLKASAKDKVGKAFTVTVLGYSPKGKTSPLAGASVKAGSLKTTSNSKGVVQIKPTKTGKLVITASKTGFVRSELTVTITP